MYIKKPQVLFTKKDPYISVGQRVKLKHPVLMRRYPCTIFEARGEDLTDVRLWKEGHNLELIQGCIRVITAGNYIFALKDENGMIHPMVDLEFDKVYKNIESGQTEKFDLGDIEELTTKEVFECMMVALPKSLPIPPHDP